MDVVRVDASSDSEAVGGGEHHLRPDCHWVRGPAGGAIYDLATGEVHPVSPRLAPWLDRHLAGVPLERLLAAAGTDAPELAALIESPLVARYHEPPRRGPLPVDAGPRPKLAWLELTRRCNFTCVHCYAEAGPAPRATLPTARWRELLVELAAARFPAVQFTGGDPFMHPDLMELVERAHTLGFALVEVYTNGAMIQPRHVERFAAWGTHVALSLYGADAATYRHVTGQDHFERVVANLRRLLAAGVPVRVGIIEVPGVDVAATIDLATELGVPPERIRVDGVRPSGRGRRLAGMGCRGGAEPLGRRLGDHTATTPVHVPLAHLAPRPPIWREPLAIPRSFRNEGGAVRPASCWQGELVIDPDGTVFPCIFAREHPLGSVADQPLATVLAGEALRTVWRTTLADVPDCAVCEFRFACFDCRALTHNLTGTVDAKPPSCIYDPHSGRFEWARWWRQLRPAERAGWLARRPRALAFEVVAEDADGVLCRDPERGWTARLEPWLVALLDLADGERTVAAVAELVAGVRGEAVETWQRRVLVGYWELVQRGLVQWEATALAAVAVG